MQALGSVETVGLVAAIEAADVACKTADVELVGYELAKGGGYVTVKVLGRVAAVTASIDAAVSAASRISRVVSTSVIPRPVDALEMLVHNPNTRGWTPPAPAPTKTSAGKSPADAAGKSSADDAVGKLPAAAAKPRARRQTTNTATGRKQA